MKPTQKILFYFKAFVLFLLCANSLQGEMSVVNEKELKKIAETQGYGYKFGNLTLLEKLSKDVNQALEENELKYKVEVPVFKGIPYQNIQKFLKEKCDFDVAEKWAGLINKYFDKKEVQEKTLETKKYPVGFMDARQKLEDEVKQAFDNFIDNLDEKFSFDKTFSVTDIDKLILDIKDKNEKFMVRSTGKEDTKELANAGGNTSVANVTPDTKEILGAMRDVVASYFGEKSLTQRLGAGDESLFDTIPFTPVLIQRMIGEAKNQIPKCGVMFTEEAEGGISRTGETDDDGKTKTTGITLIQAAYGHNEGVVNSLIPVDSFYIDESKTIYPVIRPKTHRMAPAKEGTLKLVENNGDIVKKPALDKEAVLSLKLFADFLETYYQAPMDVEFVIREDEKTVYIVQARPIVHNKNLPNPSYVTNPDNISEEHKVVGSAIGVAGGATKFITSPEQIIIKSTIGEALATYQKVDTTKIQAIIVGAMAPSTSHEATAFRSEGKPVVYLEQWQQIEHWLKNKVKLVVSPQQGLVVNWQGEETSLDDLLKNKKLTAGWESYPVPPFVSIDKDFAPEIIFDKTVLDKLLKLSDDSQEKVHFGKIQDMSWEALSKEIKSSLLGSIQKGNEANASKNLARILVTLIALINKQKAELFLDDDRKENIVNFTKYLTQCILDIKQNLTTKHEIKRLFPIKFLESLLYQKPAADEIVNGISATTIFESIGNEGKTIEETLKKNIRPNIRTIDYLKKADAAMTKDLAKEWKTFVLALVKQDKDLKETFADLMDNLETLKLFPSWLATSFALKSKEITDNKKLIEALIEEYSSQEDFLKQLFAMNKAIKAFQINALSEPKNFKTQWAIFQDNLLAYFLDKKFIDSFDKANNFAKLVAVSVMATFVDTFDNSIKAITGSTLYKNENKIAPFKTMLEQYYELFNQWIGLVQKGISYKKSKLEDYKELVTKVLLKKHSSKEDLQAREQFNVEAVKIGNNAPLDSVIVPETFEEVFTTIHQWLTVVLGVLNETAGGKAIERPVLLEKVQEAVEKIKSTIGSGGPSLESTAFVQKEICLKYNWTLVKHSVKFTLAYTKKPEQVALNVNFYGANMAASSFRSIALYVKALDIAGIFTVQKIDCDADKKRLSFDLIINPTSKVELLTTYLKDIAEASTVWGELNYNTIYAEVKKSTSEIIREYGDDILNKDSLTQEALLIFFNKLLESNFYKTLINKNNIKEIITTTFSSINSPDSDVRTCAKTLANYLIKSGFLTKEDIEKSDIISAVIKQSNLGTLHFLMKKNLIEDNGAKFISENLDTIINIATQQLASKNKHDAFTILQDFVNKDLINKNTKGLDAFIQEVINAYKTAMTHSEDESWRDDFTSLLKNLIDKNLIDNNTQGLAQIIEIIANSGEENNLSVLKSLFDNSLINEETKNLETCLLYVERILFKTSDQEKKQMALSILEKAIEKGLFEKATEALMSLLDDSFAALQKSDDKNKKIAEKFLNQLANSFLSIFTNLIKQGSIKADSKELPNIMRTAKRFAILPEYNDKSLDLLQLLVKNDLVNDQMNNLIKYLIEVKNDIVESYSEERKQIERSIISKLGNAVLSKFLDLISKGLITEQNKEALQIIIDATTKLMGEPGCSERSLDIVTSLLDKDLISSKQAAAKAAKGMLSSDPYEAYHGVKNRAFDLFEKLLDKGQGLKQAIDTAKEGSKSKDHLVQIFSLILWQYLVEKNLLDAQEFDDAFAAVIEGMKCEASQEKYGNRVDKDEVHTIALKLCKMLVEKNKNFGKNNEFEQIAETLKECSENMRYQTNRKYWVLLFENNKGFAQGAQIARKDMSRYYYDRLHAIDLFQLLFTYKKGFDEAIKAATQGIASEVIYGQDDWDKQKDALSLWEMLFKNGHGFDEARQAIENGKKSKAWGVKEGTEKLEKLLEKYTKNQNE